MKALVVTSVFYCLGNTVLIFGETSATKVKIHAVGKRFIETVYIGKGVCKGFDKLHYIYVIAQNYVPAERMPPTSQAIIYHSLKVQHQVSTWNH
jgi:hypothetical protein